MENERRHLVNMFAHDLKTPVVATAGLASGASSRGSWVRLPPRKWPTSRRLTASWNAWKSS